MDWRNCVLFAAIVQIASTAGSDLVQIEVGDSVYEEYSMTVLPSEESEVVKMAKKDLVGSLDLESFVRDLGHLGKYIRVAYNGIGAAGPKFQDLQNEVQRQGFDISKLCDKSAVTIFKFKTTTKTILYELKAAYQYLIDGKEIIAVDSFLTLAELAGKMAKAAEDLQDEFERQEYKITDTLMKTTTKRANEALRVMDIKAEREKIKVNVKIQEDKVKEHEKLEKEFKAERHRYERKEDKALSSSGGFLGRLGNVFTSAIGLGNLFDDGSGAAAKAGSWRQKSIEKLENEKEQRKLKQEALQLMAEMTHNLKALGDEMELSGVAEEALHKAAGSMSQITVLLKQATLFWNQLKVHCQTLAEDKIQRTIEKHIQHYSEEERKTHWSSDLFKQQMFLYISKWVALHSVSSTYLEQIKVTQNDLFNYISENPTYEESRKNLKQLAGEFENDLKSAQEKIKEQDFKANEEIKKLKAEQREEDAKPKTEL